MCKSVFIVEGRGVVSKPRVSVSDFARVGTLLTEMTRFATMVKVSVMDNALTTMAAELEGAELTVEEVSIVRETIGTIQHEMDVMKIRPYVAGQSMEDDRRKVAALKQQKTILRLGVEVKDLMCSILTFAVSVIIIVCIYIFVYYMCVKYGVFYSRLYSSGCFLKNEPQSVLLSGVSMWMAKIYLFIG